MSQSTKKTGIAICGFGRAGQIHFTGVLKNYRCRLLYIVDLVQDTTVKSRIQTKLEEFMVDDVKIVGKENYEKVCVYSASSLLELNFRIIWHQGRIYSFGEEGMQLRTA